MAVVDRIPLSHAGLAVPRARWPFPRSPGVHSRASAVDFRIICFWFVHSQRSGWRSAAARRCGPAKRPTRSSDSTPREAGFTTQSPSQLAGNRWVTRGFVTYRQATPPRQFRPYTPARFHSPAGYVSPAAYAAGSTWTATEPAHIESPVAGNHYASGSGGVGPRSHLHVVTGVVRGTW